jgi:hypothetical protein
MECRVPVTTVLKGGRRVEGDDALDDSDTLESLSFSWKEDMLNQFLHLQ